MKSIKILGLCLVLSLFVGVVVVDAQTAPANNVAGPLNSGSSYQTKVGSLRLTNGGFRSAGPGLFDDIVVVGYSDGSAQTGDGTLGVNTSSNQKEGIFSKLAKFFGLKTETAIAAKDIGTGLGGTVPVPIISYGQCGSAAGQSFSTNPRTTQSANALCSSGIVGNFDPSISVGTAGYWAWGCYGSDSGSHADDMVCGANNVVTTGGTGGVGEPITPIGQIPSIPFETYKFTVNGRSDLNGYTKVEGGLDVAGAITSGGKNVCLQDGTNCVAQTTSNRFWGIFTVKGGSSIPQNNGSSNCLRVNPISNFCGCSVGTHSLIASYYNFSTLSHQPGGYNGGSEYKLFTPNGLVTPDDFTNHNPNGGLLIAPSGLQREEVYMCTN